MIDEIMEYNRKFVENKGYEPYLTSKYPDKKLAILTCMDTRLLELLPAALGIKNGDAKIIKNAGGVIVHPYGSVVRSLLVGILELGVEEVMVIGHTDCGVQGMDGSEMLDMLVERGIDQQHIDIVRHSGIDLERWLGGFESVESSVHETVRRLKGASADAEGCAHQRIYHGFRNRRTDQGRSVGYRITFVSPVFMMRRISSSLTRLKSCWIISFMTLAVMEKSMSFCGEN